jgi:hypothetical protein
MPPENLPFLGATNDDMIQVRDSQRRLLGAIPADRVPADAYSYIDAEGKAYPLRLAGLTCIEITEPVEFDPANFPGFVFYANGPTLGQLKAEAQLIRPDDPDIGKAP